MEHVAHALAERAMIARGVAILAVAGSTALAALSSVTALGAQSTATAPPAAPASPTPQADTATLVVLDQPVFLFRAPFGARTARERADDAASRITDVVRTGANDSITARPIPQGMLIAAGPQGVFTITPSDLDSTAGQTLEIASLAAVARLQTAVDSERSHSSLIRLLSALGLALFATVLFLVALRLLRWGWRVVLGAMPTVAGPRIPRAAIANFTLFEADQILAFLRRIVDVVAWGLGVFAAYLWLTYVLTRFPFSAAWGEALGAYLVITVRNLLLAGLGAIPGLFTVVLIFFAARFLTRLLGTFFTAVEAGTVSAPWVHTETARPTRRLLGALIWIFALVVAYPYLPGSGSDVFKGVSVFIGLVLSLGSSGIVSQAMSGLVLMYSRALKPGDYVRIGDTEGVVMELGMLSTKIRTKRDEAVTLPNGVVVGLTTTNYSSLAGERGVVVHTQVSVRYDVPWRQVHAMLELAASRTEGLRADPPPFVLQTGLSVWHVEYRLDVRLDAPDLRVPALSALHANIQDVFYENGVDLLAPHFEGDHVRPTVAEIPRERWFSAGMRPSGEA